MVINLKKNVIEKKYFFSIEIEYILIIIIISIAELCVRYYKNFKESCVMPLIENKFISVILAFL